MPSISNSKRVRVYPQTINRPRLDRTKSPIKQSIQQKRPTRKKRPHVDLEVERARINDIREGKTTPVNVTKPLVFIVHPDPSTISTLPPVPLENTPLRNTNGSATLPSGGEPSSSNSISPLSPPPEPSPPTHPTSKKKQRPEPPPKLSSEVLQIEREIGAFVKRVIDADILRAVLVHKISSRRKICEKTGASGAHVLQTLAGFIKWRKNK